MDSVSPALVKRAELPFSPQYCARPKSNVLDVMNLTTQSSRREPDPLHQQTLKEEGPLGVLGPFMKASVDPLALCETELICPEDDPLSTPGNIREESQPSTSSPTLSRGDGNVGSISPAIVKRADQEEGPLGVLEPFMEVSVDPLALCETELICPEDDPPSAPGNIREESQLSTACPTLTRGDQNIGTTTPRRMKRTKLPSKSPSPELKEGRVLPEDLCVTTQASRRRSGPSHQRTLKVENPGALQPHCRDEFYLAEAGCSTDPLVFGLTHGAQDVFGCKMCQMQFKQKNQLKKHIRACNHIEKYHCKVCKKQFCNLPDLARHNVIHTGKKRVKCGVCSKQFTTSYLPVHSRIHRGEKPFGCHVCRKRFNQYTNLKQHYRTHTGEKPFKCIVCSKQFALKYNLNMHTRTHTGEKRFKCDVCGKRFVQSIVLMRHSRIHTGEKPFQCDVCSKWFTTFPTLNQHHKTHRRNVSSVKSTVNISPHPAC